MMGEPLSAELKKEQDQLANPLEGQRVAFLLKKARLAAGLSLEEIARTSCVSQRYLAAIEEGHYDKLPELTFAVGFVRCFAKAVGLNCDELASLFKEELRGSGEQTRLKNIARKSSKKRLPGWLAPFSGLLGLLGALLYYHDGVGDFIFLPVGQEEAVDDLAALQQVKSRHENREKPYMLSLSSLFPAAYASAIAGKLEEAETLLVHIKVREQSWLRLSADDGLEIWSGLLNEGEEISPPYQQGMRVSASNAAALEVVFAGVQAKDFGRRGQVLKETLLIAGQDDNH